MKKFYPKKLILFLVALLLVFSVQASYLRNVPQKLVQPNGKIVNCFATGDEYYHWLHDEDGFTIVQNPQTGYFCYAILSDEELVSSEYVVGEVSPSSVGLIPWINIAPRKMGELREKFLGMEKAYMIQKTGKFNGPQNVNTQGALNNVVIYIRFAGDAEYTVNQAVYTQDFNSTTPGTLSQHNYFNEVSYGTLNMNTSFLPTNNGTNIISYQDSHPRSYFLVYNASTNPTGYNGDAERTDREHTLLQAAVNSVAGQLDPGINIDNDGDGLVDNVCFIVQGASAGWSELLWPHKWSLYTKDAYINGKKVNVYNFQLQNDLDVSVLCHEMFHTLGAPDLYHYTPGTPDLDPVYEWDLMNMNLSMPQHMGQYMKWRYGKWITTIPEITTSGDYTINPVFMHDNSCYKIKSPFSQTEYFVIEYRKKEKQDIGLPNEGLLVYRINTTQDGQGNRNGPPDEVYIYRPGGSITSVGTINSAPFSVDLGRTAINDKTNPDAFLSNGGMGGLNISNISAIGATMSFHVDIFNPLNLDVAVTKLTSPVSSSTLTSTEKVKVIVTNLGITSVSSGLKINYRINGGSVVSQDFPGTLQPGTSVPFEFTTKADFSNPGVYNLEVYTTLAGDQNTENDKVTTTIINPIPLEYLAANASSTIGTYTDLTTGSTIAVDNAKNGFSAPVTFPDGFTFKFCGISFNQFILSTNGFIKLGDQNPSSRTLFFAEPQTADGGIFNSLEGADNTIIAPFAHDLVPGDGGTEYRIDIAGSAPNRIVTIQFKNVRDNEAKMPNQYSSMNFQIRLYEGSNIIEFVYGLWTPSANASAFKTSLCGLRGLGNFASQLLAVNKGSTQAWGVLAFTNGNYSTTATLNYGNTNGGARPAPEVGRVMRFIPTSGPDVSISSVTSPVSSCSLGNFEPVSIRIKNLSGEVLSNITLRYKVDAGSYVAENYSGTIQPYASVGYTFTQRADFSAAGNHNLVVSAVMAGDINTTNDSKTVTITKVVPKTMPFTENFEGSFPPTGWVINNPDAGITWASKAATGNGASTKAAWFNFWNYSTLKEKDELVSPPIQLSGLPKLKFNVAYSGMAGYSDSLKVFILTDCGMVQITEPLFKDGGENLATVPAQDGQFVPSKPSDWKTITVDLSAYTGKNISLKFVSVNDYGNDLFLDDIEIKDYTQTALTADFSSKTTVNALLDQVQFTDLTTGVPTSWSWTFSGGTPATSTDQNPIVTYSTPGTYDVSLTVTNSIGNDTKTKVGYITVTAPSNIFSAIPPLANGTSSSSRGPNPVYKYQRVATMYSIYDASGVNEINLNKGDVLKTLGFNIASTTVASGQTGNIKIYLQNTADPVWNKSTTWSTTITGMTLVYNGALTIPNTAGFYDVTLSTPFTYTGGNLYMAFEWTIGTSATGAVTYNCNTQNGTTLFVGTSNTLLPTSITSSSAYRPQIRVSKDLPSNDVSIQEIYTLGQVPAGTNHMVQAVVRNNSWLAITGRNITLDVTGGNTINNVQAVDFAPFETKLVSFDAFTIAASGTNAVKVSTEADAVTANDSKTVTQTITTNGVLSINPSTPAVANAFGNSTSASAWLTHYFVSGTKTISKVSAIIANSTTNTGKTVYALVVDEMGNILGKSDNYTILVGDLGLNHDFTIVMDAVTNIDVYAGVVKATADAYYPFAVEFETPTRPNTYFITNTDISNVTDFASLNVPYRFINSITLSDYINVAGVSVNPTSTTIEVTGTTTITPTIDPVNANNKGVNWTSSDNAIATVDNAGKVTGVSIGSVKIRATSKENASIYAESDVTVTAATSVTSVTLDKHTTSIIVGNNETLTYTVLPVNATNKSVTWSSSNTAVATVDAVGKVTAVAAGTADIKVKTVDGNFEDICTVTVPDVMVATINVTPTTLSLYTTKTSTLTATVLPANATNKGYDWSSSDDLIATVDATGKVTAVGAGGPINIIATAKDGSGITGTCAVTVTAKVDLTGITLNQTTYNLNYDAVPPTSNYTLIATPIPADASNPAVTWSSQYPTIATVDATGKVTAVSIGATVITATSVENGTITATCTINVVPIAVTGITLSNTTLTMNAGESKAITVTAIAPANATNKMVSWSSDDLSKATVNALGVITAKVAGSVNITATSVSNPSITKTCAVTINNALVGSVSINKSYKELAINETVQLGATVFAATPPATVDQTVTWTSSDDTKASVDVTGLVTGLIKDGSTVTITATSVADNTKSATCLIKVVQPVTSLTLDLHQKFIQSGQSFDLIATVNPSDADNKLVGWSTSDVNVALVDASGHVISVGSGTATITVTSQSDQTKSDVCQVTVDNNAPIITLLGDATVNLVYGDTYSDAGATALDNVDGTITSSIAVTGAPNSTSPVGTYTVHYNVVDQAGNAATEVTRTVNVIKASLTVTADNKTKVYGTSNPALTIQYSGFVNSETSAVLTTAPVAATTVDATTSAGVHTGAITVSGGAANNYSFTYVAGDFTITKATATVTITNTTQQYNGSPKPVTITTVPTGLTVDVTYAGSATVPTNPGTYAVVATVNNANYSGSNTATLTITAGVGVDPNDLSNIKIYSNSKDIYIEIPELNGSAQLSIFNILGSQVYNNVNLIQGLNKVEENLISGTYIVKVMVGNKVITQKVVLQK